MGTRKIIFFVLLMTIIPIFSIATAYEDTRIQSYIVGDSTIDLDSSTLLIRAKVEVINYDPREGHYFMQIIQPGTGKIITEKEILIREKDNDIWGSEIAYMLDEEKLINNGKVVLGNYQFKIFSEFGKHKSFVSFSVIKPSQDSSKTKIEKPEVKSELKKELVDNNLNKTQVVSLTNKTIDASVHSSLTSESVMKIPQWVKNIALWYGQGTVSEEEFINAIKFLIKEGIVTV